MTIRAKRKQERMSSISIQLTEQQEENLYLIMEFEKSISRADLVRKAIDFYVENQYPQLII